MPQYDDIMKLCESFYGSDGERYYDEEIPYEEESTVEDDAASQDTNSNGAPRNVANLANQSVGIAIMRALVSAGYTKEQAIGFAANVYGESGWDPRSVGDKGKAGGLCQWHADRRRTIIDKVASGKRLSEGVRNKAIAEVGGRAFVEAVDTSWQIDGILYELRTASYQGLKSQTTAKDAVAWSVNVYERPKDKSGAIRTRLGFINACRALMK